MQQNATFFETNNWDSILGNESRNQTARHP